MGTLLTAVCLFVLLFFVDRLARSIVFDNVSRRVATELADLRLHVGFDLRLERRRVGGVLPLGLLEGRHAVRDRLHAGQR